MFTTSPTSIADQRCTGTAGEDSHGNPKPCNNALIYVTNIGWICNRPGCDKFGVQ